MAQTGIFSIDDLKAVKYASAVDYGLDTISRSLQADLDLYNAFVNESMADFAETSTDMARIYGVNGALAWSELDEYSRGVGKKEQDGETVMFPLKTWGVSVGWTEKWLATHTVSELTDTYTRARTGYADAILKRMQAAVFNNANFTAKDPFKKIDLSVKRLVNADGIAPRAYAGSTFTTSHTHYIGTSSGSFANADIDSGITHLTEHGMTKGIKIFINASDKSAVTALSEFKALDLAVLAYSGVSSTIQKLDNSNTANQMIGYWTNGGYEVWVKPSFMIPANYILIVATGEAEKMLCMRIPEQASLQGLRIDAQYSDHPLVAQNMESIFDFGVWNRLAGVVISKTASFANPTL